MSDFDDAWARIVGREIAPAPEPKARAMPRDLVEPSEEERRNGWTADSLTKYLREREQAATARIDPRDARRNRRPQQAHSPLANSRWARTPRWAVGRSRWGPGRN